MLKRVVFLSILSMALAHPGGVIGQTYEESFAALLRDDYTSALAGFGKLAAQGNAKAQFNLATMHFEGEGTAQDTQRALYWYRKSAARGNTEAMYTLGEIYARGQAVPGNDSHATSYFRQAAQRGHAGAQTRLGLRYASGQGVPKDQQAAYFWLLLACAGGDAFAPPYRDRVEKNLTAQQRSAALAAVRRWKPQ